MKRTENIKGFTIIEVVLAVVAGGMVGAILLPIYGLVNGINI